MGLPFTLDDIWEAYSATGLDPVDRVAYRVPPGQKPQACPLHALYVRRLGRNPMGLPLHILDADPGITAAQRLGFVMGFDNTAARCRAVVNGFDPLAYDLGVQARLMLLPDERTP